MQIDDHCLGNEQSMPRFVAIDGLRAWMAWLVVIGHITQQSLYSSYNARWLALDVGGHAVDVFIIISGFVITHLLVERDDNYAAYIIPRFMRLFPAFFVCCIIGGVSYVIAHKWSDPFWFRAIHADQYRALSESLLAHTFAHLIMLHGIIPNSVLPGSEYAFIAPGWSVSLEWQFYLIAPFAIGLARSKSWSLLLVLITIVFGLFYHTELKTFWERPSFLFGTSKLFLIGIACRLAAPALAGLVSHVAAIGVGLVFTMLWLGSLTIAIWLVVYAFILKNERSTGKIDRFYISGLKLILESRPILYLADRSYSTYLLHWPILMLIGTIATHDGLASASRLTLIMLLAVPVTLILQEPLYRFVEIPGRALGKKWARGFGARNIVEVPQETVAVSAG